jgi:hypothetical protein
MWLSICMQNSASFGTIRDPSARAKTGPLASEAGTLKVRTCSRRRAHAAWSLSSAHILSAQSTSPWAFCCTTETLHTQRRRTAKVQVLFNQVWRLAIGPRTHTPKRYELETREI